MAWHGMALPVGILVPQVGGLVTAASIVVYGAAYMALGHLATKLGLK